MGIDRHWPLFSLRVTTPRLELRVPSDDDIAEIAERSATIGVHDPAFMPFSVEWTDVAPPLQQRFSMQHHWSLRANWQPGEWHLNMAVLEDGRIVGCQSVAAHEFARLRSATTGSFLFLTEHGRGIGTEMRAAILHLLFDGLGADWALTAAWDDNVQSLGVTRKLGYEPNGVERMISRGVAREQVRFRLGRERWAAGRRDDITISGLDACRDMFGIA